MDFWSSLETLRARNDVLRHPFYQRWTAGELTRPELALYAGQYRHAVVALADATAHAAESVEPAEDRELRAELDAHAREEAEHIALWDGFCEAVGGDRAANPALETERCARAWAGSPERSLLHSLVAVHVIEAAQPAISRAKRTGLVEQYGLAEGPATAYFELHAERDIEHAAASRALIAERLEAASCEGAPATEQVRGVLDEAEAVLAANWQLLDGVERRASA